MLPTYAMLLTAVTYDNGTKLLPFYVDGGLLWQTTMTNIVGNLNGLSGLFVGRDPTNNAYLRGTITQIATFDYVLSPQQVVALGNSCNLKTQCSVDVQSLCQTSSSWRCDILLRFGARTNEFMCFLLVCVYQLIVHVLSHKNSKTKRPIMKCFYFLPIFVLKTCRDTNQEKEQSPMNELYLLVG